MNPDEFTELRYEVDEGVAVLTIDRPERRNSWGGRNAVEYRWALHHAHHDSAVRVVVLTGAGPDFCVGADNRLLDTIDGGDGRYQREAAPLPPYPEGTPEQLHRNHCAPLLVSTPVIAAIEGACAGVGFVLATYADLRWIARDAKVTPAFAPLGLPAEYGCAWMLTRQLGVPNALRMLYETKVFDGDQVARLGWAQEVCDPGTTLARAIAFAQHLARHSSPASLATMKRAVLLDAAGDLATAYDRSVADMEAALRNGEMRRALAARKEKRRPDFLEDLR